MRKPRTLHLWFMVACPLTVGVHSFGSTVALAQTAAQPDWPSLEAETMQHFQALLRFDTSNPTGNEEPVAAYLAEVLQREGIPTQLFRIEPEHPNVVARIKGNGTRRPLLIMAHTDVVNVDPTKWRFPPFSATRHGGYVYGRGSVDDKDNVVAGLMTMLLLKRLKTPLDRDVIFLAEAGEEGMTRVGIQFMVNQHYSAIDAEYCLAEGGNVSRVAGQTKFAAVQTQEKNPRAIELTARGTSGHASVPLEANAVVRLSKAVATIGAWRAPIRLNPTTTEYFRGLASISPAESATRYLDVIGSETERAAAADDYLYTHEPRHSAMLRSTISPTIVQGGYRINVIPSEAKATLDVRLIPGEDPAAFIEVVRKVINDSLVDVRYGERDLRPITEVVAPGSEAFKAIEAQVTRHYKTPSLPSMSTGATDMAYLRAKGIRCYGMGPAIDVEDGPKGFGAHSDQERILESELHRFVRFQWDVVLGIAQSR